MLKFIFHLLFLGFLMKKLFILVRRPCRFSFEEKAQKNNFWIVFWPDVLYVLIRFEKKIQKRFFWFVFWLDVLAVFISFEEKFQKMIFWIDFWLTSLQLLPVFMEKSISR